MNLPEKKSSIHHFYGTTKIITIRRGEKNKRLKLSETFGKEFSYNPAEENMFMAACQHTCSGNML